MICSGYVMLTKQTPGGIENVHHVFPGEVANNIAHFKGAMLEWPPVKEKMTQGYAVAVCEGWEVPAVTIAQAGYIRDPNAFIGHPNT